MPTSSDSYHHGDLPAALLRAAMELLEQGGATELSLRAVARHAGVSAAAPYRHYADRNALLSAVSAMGYRELAAHLVAAHPSPSTRDDLAAIAITEYVEGIVRHAFPDADPEGMSTAVWALVHGLALLHLDGKLDASSADVVADRVRAAVHAMLAASGATTGYNR